MVPLNVLNFSLFDTSIYYRDKYVEFPLNPNGQAMTEEAFDIRLGYRAYHDNCRRSFQRHAAARKSELEGLGVEMASIFSGDECRIIREQMDANLSRDGSLYGNEFKKNLLHRVFNKHVDAIITGYFESEYYATWYSFDRNDPGDIPVKSFFWHCDGGPTKHLKVLLYLSDSGEKSGNTEFLDPVTTARFKELGYVFSKVDDRVMDLKPLADNYGIPFLPFQFPMKAGNAVIFNPMTNLHHGIQPTEHVRYIMQMCIIPAGNSWEATWDAGLRSDQISAWPAMPTNP